MTMSRILSLAFACLAVASVTSAHARDVDHERLSRSLSQLEADPKLGGFALGEVTRARAALQALEENSKRKLRDHLLYVAERRVDIAWAAAQVADVQRQTGDLRREHDRLQLAVARHEADVARRELERQRMHDQIRAEETERLAEAARLASEQEATAALEEADQARRLAAAQAEEAALARREAQLAGATADALRARLNPPQATRGDRGMQMSLDANAFATGGATLKTEARESIAAVVAFVDRDPSARIVVEGHTDSTGSTSANQALSQRRADAVRATLEGAGVDAARITTIGVGSERPVASNETAEGRSRNRRVDIILEQKQ